MFPNPWATSVPPPVSKPMVSSFENNAPHFPFYVTQNPVQNMSMAQSIQPNAIDPAMVQKWQEWKQWELWQQQFQQWQQQTGQITAATPQSAPPLPPGQPSLPSSQHPTIPFQNQQYSYNLPAGSQLPQLTNQPQQITTKTEVGIKRGLEPEYQNNEKKLKIDTASKKEIELNDETEALFEEQFKSWEEQFLKWKEQNKNHPDKVQYIEYEKKWLNWRDHLKQKCEILKKKREMRMAEKKKETVQVEENKLQSQQISTCNQTMLNAPILTNEPPPTFQQLHNNSSMVPSTSINQIPGLDLVSNNENVTQGFLNVSNILPQNQNGPIQTPDDKPFNFPKSITNPATINPHPINMPHGNINQPPTSMYQSSNSWSKYNNPVIYYNQKPPDVDNTSISKFGQQIENSSRLPYDEDMSNTTYNNSQNAPSTDYRRPLEGSYNKSSNDNKFYNEPQDVQPFKRHFNASSSNFRGYNQPNSNTSNFNNFNKPSEKSNIPYQPPSMMNTTASKPPSLLSLNLVKPVSLDKVGFYSENKNIPSNRYDRNWNNADDEDDPENEYMEAHKKFSSEPYDQNNEDKFSNNIQHRNVYNENNYSRGQQSARNFNDDYSRPFNQSRGSQFMKNSDNEYLRNNSQFSRNNNQSYPRELSTSKINENDYYKPPNNKCLDQGFPREAPFSKDIDKDCSNKSTFNKNYAPQKGNYGPPPPRGNYELPRGNFNNYTDRTNMEWDKNYTKNEELQHPIQNIIDPQVIKKSFDEVLPIDPVKIFDYRHLPSLKVIPGLSKETVIPIKVYDYKHGGKRILPWQDRGFSRRNINQTRDLNDKDEIIQNENYDSNLCGKTLNKNPTFNSNDTSSEEKNQNVFDEIINDNFNENKEENNSNIIETIGVNDDDDDDNNEEKEETLKPVNEVNNMCVPSLPRLSINNEVEKPSNRKLLTIDTLLCPPGRFNRPSKIVIILRGLPGSGKSYVAKLIKEKEVAMGGQAPRILSLDDYFMTEVTKTEIDPETNKKVEKKVMEYEYDPAIESSYRTSFIKAFKKKILENYFSFYIIDAINNKVTYYKDILEISRANGFTIYIIELECNVDLCIKRNIHNRTAHDINSIMKSWVKTPDDQILLDIQSLLHSTSKSEMEMEDVSDIEMELERDEETVDNSDSVENKNVDFEEEDVMKLLSCKWTDTIPQEEKMKRLDGLCKKKTEKSIKEWLQIPEDDYSINEQQDVVKDGKKRVRWADMEERREQEKMRAIGFVVGQTDWDRMLGRDQGESKLTQTKYI